MYAIMRCKKLKSMGSVASSLQHAYRERETPNADDERTPENVQIVATSTDNAMGNLRGMLPEKRRKDAVLVIEYMMSASPEWWASASKEQKQEFFACSMDWLGEKYGADRIISATIHNDETSPHLSAFVVPLTKDGRLSAKEFLGGREVLSQDQTNYHAKVAHLGLQRGVEGSKASHKTIQQYYTNTSKLKEHVRAIEQDLEQKQEAIKAKAVNDLNKAKQDIQKMTLARALEIVKAEQERRAKSQQGQDR